MFKINLVRKIFILFGIRNFNNSYKKIVNLNLIIKENINPLWNKFYLKLSNYLVLYVLLVYIY